MTKAELINVVAERANLTKKQAGEAINGLIEGIKEGLTKGEKITLVGFGSFYVAKRKARKGRNPKTGKEIKIPASKVPKFSVSKNLREIINDK
ncbi:MAG: HU family DNA-binding protein [Leptospiraceae bacterium]|nr:HU family DNA-binding protein [Leptospiraceae bacterium]